jgi:hypothetical protein
MKFKAFWWVSSYLSLAEEAESDHEFVIPLDGERNSPEGLLSTFSASSPKYKKAACKLKSSKLPFAAASFSDMGSRYRKRHVRKQTGKLHIYGKSRKPCALLHN